MDIEPEAGKDRLGPRRDKGHRYLRFDTQVRRMRGMCSTEVRHEAVKGRHWGRDLVCLPSLPGGRKRIPM